MKKSSPVLLLSMLSLAAAHTARAEEPVLMDEVVVTANRSSQSTREVSANLTVVGREELDQSVARNVGELLVAKGIGHVQKYPGSLTSIGIRGFRSDTHGNDLQGHVLVLLDGRRAGTGNVAKLLTKNVERIEIIRGPGAVQYGSAGIGGVVNIITRQGTDNSLFVEGGGGSFDSADAALGGTLLRNGFDFAGSVSSQISGDYDVGGGDRYYNTAINAETGISANLGYSFAGGQRLGLIFTRFDADEAGMPEYFDAVDLDDTSDMSNYSVDARYDGESGSGQYQWMARYFFGNDDNTWKYPTASNPSGWDDGLEISNETEQQGAQAQLTTSIASTVVTAGFDWLDYDVQNSWTPKRTTYTNPALFLLARSSFIDDRLTANIGMRYDWYSVEVEEPAGRDEDETRFTPKFGLAWMLTDALKIRAQYGQGFMMPSADQLAADYISFGTRTVGNSDLDPEKSATYEGGLDFGRSGFSASATYFYTDFEDKIVTSYGIDGSQTWKNLGDATLAGFEAELSYDIGMGLGWSWEVRPYVNLTLLTKYEDDATGEDLLYVSGTNYAAGLVVGNGGTIFCRFNFSSTGSQDVNDWQSDDYPTPIISLDSAAVADLVASWRFIETENMGSLTLRGEARNLFDEKYAYVSGYLMPGRSAYLGLRWEY